MRLSSIHRVLLSVVVVTVAGCARHEPPAPAVPPVQLVRVTLGGLSNGTVFAGEVKARHEADLGFRIGGKIVARTVEAGTRVRSGQPLARLDPADVGLQADAGRAALAAAEAEYTFAKSEYDRYQNLFREQFVSASALEQKRNLHNAALARRDQARAQLAVTQNQAAYATLVAPFDGIVTTIAAEIGQVVASGQSIAKLAREDEREVAISVPENRIGELAQAKRLGVFLWANPAKVYAARVREIAPAVDAVTRTFAVRVSILDADAAVQWGMTANVGLVSDAGAAAALLPLPALYRKDGSPAVWVYDARTKTVALRPVAVGQYREDGIVVTAGLADGEWIVAAGVNKLTPGQQVRPYEGGSGAVPPTPAAAPAAARP